MISTQDISAWANVSGSNFRLKSAEVERRTGREIGIATIKGFVEDTSTLKLGDEVDIYVTAASSDQPWNEGLDTAGQIFGGIAHSAKQNGEGVVTIEAYDIRDRLQSKMVTLEVEQPTFTYSVLKDLLEDEFGSVASSRSSASKDTPYLAPKGEFFSNTQRPWRFGNANRGVPFADAIDDLLGALGGNMWVDNEGILSLTPYPEHTEWVTPLITEINAGEETRNASRVIFEGTGTASELGQGASYVHTQTSISSASEITGGDNEPAAPEKALSDDNISTQEEADQQAFNESVRQDQKRDMGTVTIVGNADMELYDKIIIPDLTYDVTSITTPLPNDLQAGEFKINGLTQVVDSTDGFLTTIELSPPIEESYERCQIASNPGFNQQYLSQRENSVQGQQVSGQDDNTGFLSGLFG